MESLMLIGKGLVQLGVALCILTLMIMMAGCFILILL